MRFIAKGLVITMTVASGGLSACTTVDLTQVAVTQPQTASEKVEQNVVERTSLSLTRMFHAKGWCKSDPAEKTKTATNVLLNGMDTDSEANHAHTLIPVTLTQLISDMTEANYQVEQTTKAAEVYLVVADDIAELDKELSQLEAALLSSREAQAGFVKTVNALTDKNHATQQRLEDISKSIDNLKTVTDAYGDRTRSQIAARASAAGS
ncbi:MAG: hypothetical protein COB56_03695 [Robiginitomaculum sp.]|nr:MAG: hypothetical protein COB56_03695 [Robiginitomaculum sp.]